MRHDLVRAAAGIHALYCGPLLGQERDYEAELDGATLLAWQVISSLPKDDPELPPMLDEHGQVVEADGDPDVALLHSTVAARGSADVEPDPEP